MLSEKLAEIGTTKVCPCIILIKDGKLLLGLRQYRTDYAVWIAPGGKCEVGETVEQALRREVQEETGITDVQITAYLGEVPAAQEGFLLPLFVGTTVQEPALLEPDKFLEWRWVPVAEYLSGEPYGILNPRAFSLAVAYFQKNG